MIMEFLVPAPTDHHTVIHYLPCKTQGKITKEKIVNCSASTKGKKDSKLNRKEFII